MTLLIHIWIQKISTRRESLGSAQTTGRVKLFPVPCIIKIVQMVFFQCAKLLPSRLLPSLALPPKQILVTVTKTRQTRRAAVLSCRRSARFIFQLFLVHISESWLHYCSILCFGFFSQCFAVFWVLQFKILTKLSSMPPREATKCLLYMGRGERWENLREVIFLK